MGIGVRQQTRTECVGVVHLAVQLRNISDAHSVAVRKGIEVTKNMLAGTDRDLQILVVLIPLVGIQKSMTDQRGPYDRGHTPGKVKTTGLIIKMIAPTSATVALALVVDQPLQHKLHFVCPSTLAGSFMEAHATPRYET